MLGQARSTQRHVRRASEWTRRLEARIVELACEFGRNGYRRITALLQREGWNVNHKRVERIWRRESVRIPRKQPKRGRLWLNDGSCVRLRATRPNHVWSYDFVHARTHDGRPLKLLTMVDELTRECLCIDVARRLRWEDVLYRLGRLMLERGVPEHVRSDNGPDFIATALREWLGRVGAKTLFIAPGSPWESGYVESTGGKLRDELLNGEIFYTLHEARVVIGAWRRDYNHIRPHSSLDARPPAPEARLPAGAGSASLRLPLRAPARPSMAGTRSPRFQPGDQHASWHDRRGQVTARSTRFDAAGSQRQRSTRSTRAGMTQSVRRSSSARPTPRRAP